MNYELYRKVFLRNIKLLDTLTLKPAFLLKLSRLSRTGTLIADLKGKVNLNWYAQLIKYGFARKGTPKMLLAKDIMSIDVFSVQKDTLLCEAINVMLSNYISGVPVVESDMTLVGIFTEKDALQLYKNPEKALNITIEDFMMTPAVFFDEDETIEKICDCLINNDFRRVPVTANGKVVGVISRPDVIECILKATGEHKLDECT